jgi:sulfur carrier protein ThiS
MKITFKLFASLTEFLPQQARYTNVIEIDVPPGASISETIAPYGLPEKLVHLVLVNGTYIPPERRLTHILQEGDALAIWPPIAGG